MSMRVQLRSGGRLLKSTQVYPKKFCFRILRLRVKFAAPWLKYVLAWDTLVYEHCAYIHVVFDELKAERGEKFQERIRRGLKVLQKKASMQQTCAVLDAACNRSRSETWSGSCSAQVAPRGHGAGDGVFEE